MEQRLRSDLRTSGFLGYTHAMTPEQLKDLLRRNRINPNKTFGQNFLMDDFVLQDMVDAAGVTGEDVVLEVGPGIATLTKYLLERAKAVFAVEKDAKFLPILRRMKKDEKNFDYAISDILAFDFAEALSKTVFANPRQKQSLSYKVVANIPYYITGKIIQLFLKADHKPKSLTLLVQKEVAQNIVAKPGQLNLLGISVQLYGTAKLVQKVPAKSFFPAPKVDSAIIHIELDRKPRYQLGDEKKFFRILRACFAGKRKQIHNTLVNNLGLDKNQVTAILQKIKIDPQVRPQQLTIGQWLALTKEITL
jgi:16S rRNA (adenine1518-N6/adenine1519-N6)-dimethyltransferase